MKKLLAVLLALSCMLIGAAAVAETLNVAYMPNYGSLWSVETAINKGYFEEEGLTLNLVEFADGPTIIAAMESGSIDVGYIGQGAHKLCINGRASIFALSHISNGDALIGGKGIATMFGAFLFMHPLIAIVLALLVIAFIGLIRIVSLASLLGVTIAATVVISMDPGNLLQVINYAAFWLLAVVRHWGNIKRLLKGEERKLDFRSRKKREQGKE